MSEVAVVERYFGDWSGTKSQEHTWVLCSMDNVYNVTAKV